MAQARFGVHSLVLVAAVAIVSFACGSERERRVVSGGPPGSEAADSPVQPLPVPAAAPRASPRRGTPTFDGPTPCRDTGGGSASCAAGFAIDDVFYAISCGAVRADAVSNEIVATGTYHGVATEVRRITNVDPSLLLAIRLDGGSCGDHDRPLSAWSMLFPRGPTDSQELRDAVCAATVDEHRARNMCPEG